MFLTNAIKVLWKKINDNYDTLFTKINVNFNTLTTVIEETALQIRTELSAFIVRKVDTEANERKESDKKINQYIATVDDQSLKNAGDIDALKTNVATLNTTINDKASKSEVSNALSSAKAYTDTQVSKIDVSNYATKSDLNEEIGNRVQGDQATLGNAIAYTNNAIGEITQFDYQVVTELPTTGVKGIMYLIAKTDGAELDYYDEYIWVGTRYEHLGNTKVDLSGYYTKTETDERYASMHGLGDKDFIVNNLYANGSVNTMLGVSVTEGQDGADVVIKDSITGQALHKLSEKADKLYVDSKVGNDIKTTQAQEQPKFGEELLTSDGWTLGSGWSGNVDNGFTHTSSATSEPLTFALTNSGTKLYQVCFTSTTTLTETNLLLSLGNSADVQFYGQRTPIFVAIRSKSNGNLVFTPDKAFAGTIAITSIKEIIGNVEATTTVTDSTNTLSNEVRYSTDTNQSLFIGKNCGKSNSSGYGNVGLGYNAFANNASGFWNVGIGYRAFESNTCGSRCVSIGYGSLMRNEMGHRNVSIGTFSLNNNVSGSWNISIGADNMNDNTTGNKNVSIGFQSLARNTTGNQNTACGSNSLQAVTTGNLNVGLGNTAGNGIKTGTNNLAIGSGSLQYCEGGNYNVAVGGNALYGTKNANYNVAIGYMAGKGSSGTSFKENVFVGASTGGSISGSAYRNIIIGYNAGSTLTTGSNNIVIGATQNVDTPTGNYQLNIGGLIKGNMSGNTTQKSVNIDGMLNVGYRLVVSNMATSDPHVAGQFWNDNGTVKVSAG